MDGTAEQAVEAAQQCDLVGFSLFLSLGYNTVTNLFIRWKPEEPYRVIIRALVTDIDAKPNERVMAFGRVFASQVLHRAFNPRQQDIPHDEAHYLP